MSEKTCGNCESYYEVRPSMKQGQCLSEGLIDGCAMLHRANEEACDAWEAAPLTLEQRYEQLARVAKEMLREINSCYEIADGVWHNGEYYRAQLEALGVVLDD